MTTSQAEFYRGSEAASAALAGHTLSPPPVRAAVVHKALAVLFASGEVQPPRACAEGCAHCCHFPVGVTYGEAMVLAAAAQQEPTIRERLRTAAQETAELAWSELVGLPCPFLWQSKCSVYEHRPLPCRALASSNAESCRDALSGRGVPHRDEVAFWRGLGAAAALLPDHPAGNRELRSSVAALLDAPRARDPVATFGAAKPTPA